MNSVESGLPVLVILQIVLCSPLLRYGGFLIPSADPESFSLSDEMSSSIHCNGRNDCNSYKLMASKSKQQGVITR